MKFIGIGYGSFSLVLERTDFVFGWKLCSLVLMVLRQWYLQMDYKDLAINWVIAPGGTVGTDKLSISFH